MKQYSEQIDSIIISVPCNYWANSFMTEKQNSKPKRIALQQHSFPKLVAGLSQTQDVSSRKRVSSGLQSLPYSKVWSPWVDFFLLVLKQWHPL